MPVRFRTLAAASVSLALLAVASGYFFSSDTPPTTIPSSASVKSVQVRHNNQQLSQQSAAQLANPDALPATLQGTRHGIALETDVNGHLRLQPQLLELFDFYFSAIDEEPVAQILLRIHHDLTQQLQEPALTQARDLLKRYLDYRLAMADLPAGSAAPTAQAFAQHLDALTRLRAEYFSDEETQAFFSSDLNQDQFMLAQLRLSERDLSPEQQRRELALLEASLPAEQRAVRQQVSRDGELYAATEAMRAAGASDEAIYQLRASTLDPQAASALQQLDEQRRQWQTRLQAYASERNNLRQSGLSPADQQQAIEQLRAQRFDQSERLRVIALDEDL